MSHPFFQSFVYEHDQQIMPRLKTLRIISLTLKMNFHVQFIHVMLCKVDSMLTSPRQMKKKSFLCLQKKSHHYKQYSK